jgi:hypothetical protein
LEEGATAVAVACPPSKCPPFMWERIERAVKEDQRTIVPLFGANSWTVVGWAAAAACLAAWIFFGVYRNDSGPKGTREKVAANGSEGSVTNQVAAVEASNARDEKSIEGKNEITTQQQQAKANERESEKLRSDLENLQRQIGQMSQALTQQQAMLNEPNRFKMLTLAPTANAAPLNGLSPQLQRALFLAMARDLGWLGSSNAMMNPAFEEGPGRSATNMMGVDFVDLRSTNSGPVRFKAEKNGVAETKLAEAPPSNDGTIQLANAIPGFATATDVVVALDSTVAAVGSDLVFSIDDGLQVRTLGTASMGSNPLIVKFQAFANQGFTFHVGIFHAATPGQSNLLEFTPLIADPPRVP